MVVVGESVDTDVDTVVCAAVVDTNGVVIAPAKKYLKTANISLSYFLVLQ